ncbi:MAG: segregation and condensation protein A [Mycoplasmatales bacterium]
MSNNKLIFKIEDFEGPLDLLLELFKQEKLEITVINLKPILEQYVQYIAKLQQQNYNIAVEYLDLMAEIILYKSKKVLQEEVEEEVEEDELNQEELIRRLLEYQTYKEATKKIDKLKDKRHQYLIKELTDLKEFKEVKLQKIEYEYFYQIIEKTFSQIYLKEKKENAKIISKKDYNIKDYIKMLKGKSEINFQQEIKNKQKKEVIIIFLAILELLKLKEFKMYLVAENIMIIKENNEE